MRKAVFLLAVLFLTAAAGAAETFGERLSVTNCETSVTLREAPSRKAKKTGELVLGEEVYDTGLAADGFTRVWSAQGEGWVLSEYLAEAPWTAGEPWEMDEAVRIRLNLFLTVFSGTGIERFRPGWTQPEETILWMAIRRARLYPDENEEGTWPEGDRRVPAAAVTGDAKRYFGVAPAPASCGPFTLRDGWLFWRAEEAPAARGFAVVRSAEILRGDLAAVRLTVFGDGAGFRPEAVCSMDARGAAKAYPKHAAAEALALIRLGGDPADESAWRLLFFLRGEPEEAPGSAG